MSVRGDVETALGRLMIGSNRSGDVRTINDQGEPQDPMHGWALNKCGGTQQKPEVRVRNNSTNVEHTISGAAWDQFWELFDMKTAPTSYKQIKQNAHWQGTYDGEDRNILYRDRAGNYAPRMTYSIACMGCGIVLPLNLVTIDHVRPRRGGAQASTFKVLRALGVTTAQPKGRKGQYLRGMAATLTADLTAPALSALTWNGVVIVSSILHAGQYDTFCQEALAHFMNLQPMCLHCNSSKGNWAYA
jgi:hypothetical protein